MLGQTTDHNSCPVEPETPEPMLSQTDTADAAALNDAAGPQSQVAPTASDSPEATATSLVKHDAFGNPDLTEDTTDHSPSLVEPGIPEPTLSQIDTADAAASNDAAAPESQVARAASDSPEATATSPVKHDAVGNPGMPEQTSDPNSCPAEPGAAEPTSPQEDTSDAGAREDEAGAEGQVSAVPSKAPENNLPPTAGASVTEPAEGDDDGCFEPYIPPVSLPPTPKPVPKPEPKSLMHIIDKAIFGEDYLPTASDTTSEPEIPAPAAAEDRDDAEIAKPSEILTAPVEAPLPPPRVATAAELHTWIKRVLLAQTHLAENAADLTAFWAISTHFQDALSVLPCLVITGPAHDAVVVLHVLSDFCRGAKMLAGIRRSHLDALRRCQTNLVSEPNLDKRTADLLSNLTDRNFLVVQGPYMACYSKSTAIYAGENPETPRIQNSIHIHITATNSAPPDDPQWLRKMVERIPVDLDQYRDKNLSYVRRWTWVPSGLSSETAAIAAPLGRCVVGAPEVRQKLVALLKSQDQQRLSEMSNTTEAVILDATLALSRDGRELAYAHEIATAANRLLEARGETARLNPERVGHRLSGLGLRTRRLSKTGNGLMFDKTTVARIRELAAVYGVDVMEGTPVETENLHSHQTTENK
jgi:hypothetical protein